MSVTKNVCNSVMCVVYEVSVTSVIMSDKLLMCRVLCSNYASKWLGTTTINLIE